MTEPHEHRQPTLKPPSHDDKCPVNGAKIAVPKWIFSLMIHVIMLLVIGALSTLAIIVVWISMLTASTNRIVDNQEKNRETIEKNQKAIIRRVDEIKKNVAPKSKLQPPEGEP